MDRPPTQQREDPGGKRVENSESFIGERKSRLDEETPEQPKMARKKEISVALRLSAYTAQTYIPCREDRFLRLAATVVQRLILQSGLAINCEQRNDPQLRKDVLR